MSIVTNREVVTFAEMNLPKILYKYRDWNNHFHKTILTERKVYFAQPTSFEDPLFKNKTKCGEMVNYVMQNP